MTSGNARVVGRKPNDMRMRIASVALRVTIVALCLAFPHAVRAWTSLNISSNLSVNVLVRDGNALYAGTSSGLFRTTDEGESWIALTNGLTWGGGVWPSVLAMCMVGDTLLAGTDGHGLYRSMDRGVSWISLADSTVGMKVRALVATAHAVYAATERGVLRSLDAGQTWTLLADGFPSSSSTALCLAARGDTLFCGTRNGMFIAPEATGAWSRASDGLSDTVVTAIAVNPMRIVVATAHGGLFEAPFAGAAWRAAIDGLPASAIRAGGMGIAFDGNTAYVGTSAGVYRAADTSMQWTAANAGMPAAGRAVAGYGAIVASNGTVFAGAYGTNAFVPPAGSLGVYRSRTSGASWEMVNAGLSYQYLHLFPGAARGRTVYAGSSTTSIFDARSAIYRSTDDGAHWRGVEGDEIESRALLGGGDSLVAGTITFSTDESGVARSSDGGATWTMITDSASRVVLSTAFETKEGISVLATRGDTAIAATMSGGTYWSSNAGVTWTAAAGLDGRAPVAVVFANDVALAATAKGVYRSDDAGRSWAPDTAGMGAIPVISLAIDGTTLVAGTGASSSGSPARGAFMRTGGGAWVRMGGVMPASAEVRDLATFGSAFVAATDNGLYRTEPSGSVWIALSSPEASSGDLQTLAITDSVMFVASPTGIFSEPLATLLNAVADGRGALPVALELTSIHPNPATASATATIDLPIGAHATVSVIDALGRAVRTTNLIAAGAHVPCVFDVRSLPAGIYVCVLKNARGSVARRTFTIVR